MQFFQRVRAVSFHGLFYHMVKHFLNEGIVRGLTANRELAHIARPRKPNLLAIIGHVFADRINRFFVFARAEAPHSVVLLETESERIDYGMTALTSLRTGQLRHLLPHRQVWSEIRVLEGHCHWRRLKGASHDV